MQSADVATRLAELAATQERAIEVVRSSAIELAALSASLADAPGSGPSSGHLNTLTALLQQLSTAPDPETLARALVEAAVKLLPASVGAISMVSESGGADIICAWNGSQRWSLRATPDPTQSDLLRHIAAQPAELAVRFPLSYLGMEAGELRVWPSGAGDKEFAQGCQLLGLSAGMALGGLALKHRLSTRSVRDALTGLFNRRYMEDTLNRELHRARRNATPVGLLLLDVDRLRDINERHGAETGDRLLEAIGGLLLASFRGSDVCCRIDGQRFVVILPEAPLADSRRRADEVLRLITQIRLSRHGDAVLGATACAGVAALPDHADTVDSLLMAAEGALYLAKRDGRGRARTAEKGV